MLRTQTEQILRDLVKKMVFIVGPRQVGKTWLSSEIMKKFEHPLYLNYDNLEDRKIIKAASWLPTTDLVVMDEIHKMDNWKSYIKGIYDNKPEELKILVTGSARLDTFRQAGDSLAGRYFIHHLLPFSYKEALQDKKFTLDHLIERGGFPEPLLAETIEEAKRWRKLYTDSLIREDILDFENIQDLRSIQLLLKLLRSRVASPLSISNLAQELGKSPHTVKKYIEILEALFIIFRVTPYSKNIARSLLKEPKIYFYDNGLVEGDAGILLENFIAVSLLKHVSYLQNAKGIDARLHYLRTKEKREVDFCLVEDEIPTLMLEVKNGDSNISKQLIYFNERYNIPGKQIVKNLRKEFMLNGLIIEKAENFLKELSI